MICCSFAYQVWLYRSLPYFPLCLPLPMLWFCQYLHIPSTQGLYFLALYGHFVLLHAKHCIALLDLKVPHLLANKHGILQTVPSSAPDLHLQGCNFGHPAIHLLGHYILTCLDQDS